MIGALKTHAKSRGLLAGGVALVALVVRFGAEAPPPRSVEGVAALLGRAAAASVKPDDFLWEERGGFLHDAFVGRRVLFLASDAAAGPSAPRDLYRARVRLTRAGRPISVADVRNLTRTPLGDDRDLAGAGHHVAFATQTAEGVQGITVLDLAGPGAPTHSARVFTWIDRWLATGSTRGLARTEIAFERPPEEAKLEVGPGALVMALGAEGVPAAFDFATSTVQTGRTNPFGAAAQSLPEMPRPPAVVLTDLAARALGPRPAALASALARGSSRLALPTAEAAAPAGLRIAADYPIEGGWPPAPIAPAHPKPFDGEGFWHVAPAIQSPEQQVAPPPLLEATIRPDTNNPDRIVHLVAVDTRRLDLRVVPGLVTPEPAFGPRGSGRLPRGPDAARVVAAFVAGPPPSAQPLGFLGEGRLLAPLVPGAPTLAIRPDGRAALGVWPADGERDAFVAIAQAPDALVSGAPTITPAPEPGASTAPTSAAFAPANASSVTGRAALCRTAAGYLVYAFTPAAEASTLRAGLTLAGCAAAVHLGTSPAPLGFAYARAADDGQSYSATIASRAMTMPVDRIADPWLHEIAVLVKRDTTPAVVSAKDITWSPDEGPQPPPAWLPSVLSFETEKLGAKVKVTALLPDRVRVRIAVGKDEGQAPRGQRPGPSAEERASSLLAIGLSVARRGARRGLVVNGTELIRPTSNATWLVLDAGRARIVRAGEPLPAGADATEATLVADEQKLLPVAREVGTQRPRTSACALPDGTLAVAHTTFDTDEAATEALLDLGCERVVSLDRGAHDGVFAHRAGSPRPPEPAYDATTLYVLPIQATGTATDLR